MIKRKICVFTSARSEYGIMYPLIKKLSLDPSITLQLIAASSHLSSEHGYTVQEIEQDGFKADGMLESLVDGRTFKAMANTIGLLIIQLTEQFSVLKPDIVVILGDRYETFACAIAAASSRVPIAHIHGGEITAGAIDDLYRHATTKLAQLHFTATNDYRKRVLQLGERPERVHYVGSMGVENALSIPETSREEFLAKYRLDARKPVILMTYHPETMGKVSDVRENVKTILGAIDKFRDHQLLLTRPNADPGNSDIIEEYQCYLSSRSDVVFVNSLGRFDYLYMLKYADIIIGNSSSGIIEANALKTPCVNIGNRQARRAADPSVINCDLGLESISKALTQGLDADFRKNIFSAPSIYQGPASPSNSIFGILKDTKLDNLLAKEFEDISFEVRS